MKKMLKIFIITLLLCISLIKVASAQMDEEVAFLAATLWGEARGEGTEGMTVVANTIINRKKFYQNRAKNGKTITAKDVVLAYKQYSYWNDKNWTTQDIINDKKNYSPKELKKWNECISIATRAVHGKLKDLTGGAMNYYASSGANKISAPAWARGTTNVTTIGHHTVVRGVAMGSLILKDRSKIAGGGGGSSGGGSSGGGSYGSGNYQCPGNLISKKVSGISGSAVSTSLFSTKILLDIQTMMESIYKNLSQVFVLGHALMCYASEIAYTCIGPGKGVISFCVFTIPSFSYLIVGLVIYVVAFFMTMCVGMYFLDISFKLGFAVLFLPISIALWPFPPTKNKFSENLSIVIRNSMLFAFMSIGAAYAIILMQEGIIGDTDTWNGFWEALSKGRSGVEAYAANGIFSLDSTHVIVIAFCLIFGFKILASSVNDYLDTFFSDGVFGSDSPMHKMGTQAIAFAKAHTVDPVASFASDVAMTQAGKAVAGTGRQLNKMAHGDFSGPKNIAHAISHPVATSRKAWNNTMQKTGEAANKTIHKLGNMAADTADMAQMIFAAPGTYNTDRRAERTEKLQKAINKTTDKIGNAVENGISHGGGYIKNATAPAVKMAKEGVKTGISKATASTINSASGVASAITKNPNLKTNVTADQARNALHTVKSAMSKEGLKQGAEIVTEASKQGISAMGATTLNAVSAIAGKEKNSTTASVREALHTTREAVISGAKAVEQFTRPTAKTLRPSTAIPKVNDAITENLRNTNMKVHNSNVVSKSDSVSQTIGDMAANAIEHPIDTGIAAGKGIAHASQKIAVGGLAVAQGFAHPKQTYNTIKKLASQMVPEEVKNAEGAKAKGKIILKNTGQVVLRTARANVEDVAKGTGKATLGLTGSFLEKLGQDMQKHNHKSSHQKYEEEKRRKDLEEAEKLEEQERNRTIDV